MLALKQPFACCLGCTMRLWNNLGLLVSVARRPTTEWHITILPYSIWIRCVTPGPTTLIVIWVPAIVHRTVHLQTQIFHKHIPFRESSDHVYGILQLTVLSMKRALWQERLLKKKLTNYTTQEKSLVQFSPLYPSRHQMPFKTINLQCTTLETSGSFIALNTKRESVTRHETPQQIILSLECKSGVKDVHGNKFDPLFEKNVCSEKYLRRWIW